MILVVILAALRVVLSPESPGLGGAFLGSIGLFCFVHGLVEKEAKPENKSSCVHERRKEEYG